MNRYEIILAGIGGQGLLLAGLIVGDAAAISDGKYAVQTETYAPLARGGSSKSEIIISEEEIDYPKVRKADLLVALSQEAYDSNINQVKNDGLIIIETDMVKSFKEHKNLLSVPLTSIAMESTKKPFTVSIVALGVVSRVTGRTNMLSLVSSIGQRAPNGTEDINQKALEAGFLYAEKLHSRA